jgi:hypothetical protein
MIKTRDTNCRTTIFNNFSWIGVDDGLPAHTVVCRDFRQSLRVGSGVVRRVDFVIDFPDLQKDGGRLPDIQRNGETCQSKTKVLFV